jgi:hypothetical protein
MNKSLANHTFFVILALSLFLNVTQAFASRTVEQIALQNLSGLLSDLPQESRDLLDVIGLDQTAGTVDLLVDDTGRQLLSHSGIPFSQLKSTEDLRDDRVDDQYLDYSEVTAMLANYETQYPAIAKRYNLATTAEGRTVWAMKISDSVATQEDEPEILFIGLHHAREIMSTEINMDMINYLLTQYSSNPDVAEWVSTWQIWIIPMLNPDGSAYCWSDDQYWVKNRRNLGSEIYGVDLGHNYPFEWGSCFGSSADPNSNSYRGPGPGSESEILGVTQLAQQHHFVAMLSYHSFNELVLTPYGCYGEDAPEKNILQSFGNSFASLIRKDSGTYGYGVGSWWEMLYSSDGNETDYFYSQFGTMAFSLEVNASSYYPAYSMRNQTVERNRPGWQKVLDVFDSGNIIHGHVFDACTGLPVAAEYHFQEYPLTETETPRTADPETGKYLAVGRPGHLTLTLNAPGYIERTVALQFNSSPIQMDIELLPVNEPGLVVWATQIDDTQYGDGDMMLDPNERAVLKIALLAPGLSVSGISASITTSDPYIGIIDNSATCPDLPGGGAAWTGSDSFEIIANAATPDGHVAILNITFQANEDLCSETDTMTVTVQSYVYLCPFWGETLDTDPGWEISAYPTSGSPPGPYYNWAFGVPHSGPPSAYSGENVYGTGLNGNYDNNWTLCLTTPPIDCSDLTDATLVFARFLQVEDSYDSGRVRIQNSATGSWTTIFNSTTWPGWTNDSNWNLMELDISDYADNESYVRIRFDVRADSSISLPGFYIDDVAICGNFYGAVPPPPTPTMRPTSTPTQYFSPSPTPTMTWTPMPNTPTFTHSPTVGPGTPTNTPITPTSTPTLIPPTRTPTHTPESTITPTPTGQATRTPTQTWTPDLTFTPKPTATPTPTSVIPSPTATSTSVSPTPSFTPVTSSPTPTPTTGEMFAIALHLSDTYFEPGEEFALECEVERHGTPVTVDQYILLEVVGSYYFWPSWSDTLDFDTITYYDGYHDQTDILRFTWPTVGGHFSGIKFYAGCLYTGTATLIGDISFVEFGY